MGKALRELFEAIFLALLVFFTLQISLQNFRVEGSSMEPTLGQGERLLVNKLVYFNINLDRLDALNPFWESSEKRAYLFHPPRRGEIVVFRFPKKPSRDFVKRIIGMPGDNIKIIRGKIYIDGLAQKEPYIIHGSNDSKSVIHLAPGEYFVLGDNREWSSDSRTWGPVPQEAIFGRVWVKYSLPSSLGFLERLTAVVLR